MLELKIKASKPMATDWHMGFCAGGCTTRVPVTSTSVTVDESKELYPISVCSFHLWLLQARLHHIDFNSPLLTLGFWNQVRNAKKAVEEKQNGERGNQNNENSPGGGCTLSTSSTAGGAV